MPPAHRPAHLVGRVFLGRTARERGWLTPEQLRSAAWRRVMRGVYADAGLADTHGLRLAAARLVLPPAAVVAGRSAAWLLGVREAADAATPVEVLVPRDRRFGPVTGLRVRQGVVDPVDVTELRGLRFTTGLRTASDVARWEPTLEAVVLVDLLLARDVVQHAELRTRVAGLGTGPGARRAVQAVQLADRRAESPQESRTRVVLSQAGFTVVPQFEVRDDDGRWVARVDLALPELRIAVEYDGAWHGEGGQLAKDRRRLNRLTEAGWLVLHLTAADLRRPEEVVARLRALVALR
ncbi:endonuclease domain-containing protein [Klenkia taihuensis]|uniref:T/G mismatch-specific endonuclease n=1 Tax=Klenkia taihuensis TaxID=1225127 RepID=A0A1I1JQJ6_9ACTN|nr:DUF559 domain-containing protein [Klenkia taihuensis]GHE10751.1 hypothetical protein GCM10011381_21250 [Klenkia taihuensis]SFC50927.1 T/G mismatch-specific endonuclease [Klenkia taihuensis]